MISLRRRIILGSVVLTAVVVGVAVAAVFAVSRWQALRMLDGEVAGHLARMQHMARRGPPPGPPPDGRGPRESPPPGWDEERRRLLLQITDLDGGREFMRPAGSPALAGLMQGWPDGTPGWAILPDGRRVRGARMPLAVDAPDGSGFMRGHVAIDASAIAAEQARLGLVLATAWATATLLALAAAWWLRRAVAGPLDRLAEDLRRIDPERLYGRVHEGVPIEMAAAARLLNQLLDRLEQMREREKGTIASIAHELRSPVSGLRTALEVAALDTSTSAPQLAARLLPTVTAMHGMIANLLALARLEAGHERVDLRRVEVDPVLDGSWTGIRPAADQRAIRLRRGGTAGLAVASCPDRLRMILGNLLDNAATYAPEGAEVALRADPDGGQVVVTVANPLSGPPPDLQQIFTPFWRGDRARSSIRHCGLGLALARRLAVLIGADLGIRITDGQFIASLRMPSHAGDGDGIMHGCYTRALPPPQVTPPG